MHLAMLMPAPPARQPRSSARSPSGCCTSATRCPALATPPAGNGATAVSPQLLEVMQNVANGVLTASDAALQLNQLVAHPGGGEAEVAQRAEFPEVVWGADKGAGQILTALQRIADRQGMAAATRVPPATAAEIVATAPEATYHAAARMLVLKSATTKQQKLPGSVALICAGTADATVVEECRLMLASCGCYAFKLAESGVMGMHRWGCRGEAGCIDKALQLRLQLQLTHCVRPGFLADWELQQRARLVLELGATLPISNYPSRPCLPALPAPPAGLCRTWTPSRPPTSSSASLEWTAGWPQWWPAWWRSLSLPCPPAPATEPPLGAWPPCWQPSTPPPPASLW